jgi:outer membrane protein TolC
MTKQKFVFIGLFFLISSFTYAQEVRKVSLQECMDQAVIHHPLYSQYQLQSQSSDLKKQNIKTALYPQLTLNGRATIQNKVISLPISLPGVSIPEVSKDQYRLSLDVNQAIYRGGIDKQQYALEEQSLDIAGMQTNEALYRVKSDVKRLFFQLVLSNKQMEIVESYRTTLGQKLKELQVLVEEGVALASTQDVLKLEYLNTEQELFNIKNTRQALLKNLELLTNIKFDQQSEFVLPVINTLPMTKQNRFEYQEISLRQMQLETSKNILDAKKKPMLFAFASGGFGRPGFNMLSNDFDDFMIFGLNLKWNFWDWNKTKNEKKIIDMNKQLLDAQKQNFDLNIRLGLNQTGADIEKQRSLIKQDPELIALRENVVKTAEAQFKNGTLTSFEYIQELQKLNQTKLNYEIHQISLINSQMNYLELLGKL